MLCLTLFWLSLPRTFGDERFFLKWTCLIKKSILGVDHKPLPKDILYIDVAGSKTLLDVPDPLYQEMTGFHHTSITDREQLSALINYISEYGENISLLVLDLTFEQASPADSLFQECVSRFPFPLLGASRIQANGRLAPSVITLPTAVASYLTTDNNFMKYPLFLADSLPTLPLVMLGILEKAQYKKRLFWPTVNGRISLANPIIDFKIRPFDFNDSGNLEKEHFTVFSLGTLLFEWGFWDEADIRGILKDKLIIIGDFREDVHQTVFGQLAGPVVLHNAYLTLKEGGNLISWVWLLLFYLFFWWLSYRITKESNDKRSVSPSNRSKTALGAILKDSIDEAFILVLATIVSYFVFNIHVNILVLLLYLKTISYFYSKLSR